MGMIRSRDDLRKKGTSERPFYFLRIEWKKPFCGVLEIVPYLFIEENELGPRLVLKEMWPDPANIDLSIPVAFWYREKSGAVSIETSRASLIELAYKTEENYNIYATDSVMQLNAALEIGFCDKRMLTEQSKGLVTAVRFFAIRVSAPDKLGAKDWEILKKWKILK